jgi:hypothetical protein
VAYAWGKGKEASRKEKRAFRCAKLASCGVG